MAIARDMHWQLDYIDSLSVQDIGDYNASRTAEQKVTEANSKKKGR